MRQVMAVAGASVREHSRRKLIGFFVIVSLVVAAWQIYLAVQGAQLPGVAAGPSDAATLAAAGFWGSLALIAALAVSMGNIGRPFSDGEAMLVLSRPVARWHYAAGRLLASVGLVAALCLLMGVEMQAIRMAGGAKISSALWGHWAVQAYNLSIVAAITTLVSVFSASPVIAAIVAFLIDRFAAAVGVFYRLVELGEFRGGLASLVRVAWFATPKELTSPLLLNQLDSLGQQAARRIPIGQNSPGLVLWSFGYLALAVAAIFFTVSRKEVRG